MIQRTLIILSVGAYILGGCGKQERERLTSQVDSLQQELYHSQQASHTLQEVGVLIDSIDASRQLLRTKMVEGTSYDDYVSRMNDLHAYVKSTMRKIKELETTSYTSKATANAYASTIKKLKGDLEKSAHEIDALQELVSNIRNENQNLVTTVGLKDAELIQKEETIQLKQQQLNEMEAHVKEMMVQSKNDEAESYYLRAQAIEETANRTKFAPKKKKETVRQALELYKMALFLGKEEAEPKVAMLEARL